MNKLIVLLFMIQAPFCLADGHKCREVTVTSRVIEKNKKADLCFMKDESYFISRNCMSLECDIVYSLKKTKYSSSISERPGASLCKALGGAVDTVTLSGIKGEDQMCVLPKSETSISLNMLESWNGKFFAGPAETIKF